MSDISDLVQSALNQDYNKANQVFGDLMGEKIGNALEQEKIAIADQIFNGVTPPEELEDEDDDEVSDDVDYEDDYEEDIEDTEEEDGTEQS